MAVPPPPPRCCALGDGVAALAIGGVVAGFLAFVALDRVAAAVFGTSNPLTCCPGGASMDSRVGIDLRVGDGAASCPASGGTEAPAHVHRFPLTVDVGGGEPSTPIASDLAFGPRTGGGSSVAAPFPIHADSPGPCLFGEGNSSPDRWREVPESSSCPSAPALETPLATGDPHALVALPCPGPAFHGAGDLLVVEAVGGGYDGSVTAALGNADLTEG